MANQKKINLNQAFSQLEEIVDQFESGEIEIEDSIKKFEQGLKLAKSLKNRLKKLENEMIELKEQYEDED